MAVEVTAVEVTAVAGMVEADWEAVTVVAAGEGAATAVEGRAAERAVGVMGGVVTVAADWVEGLGEGSELEGSEGGSAGD